MTEYKEAGKGFLADTVFLCYSMIRRKKGVYKKLKPHDFRGIEILECGRHRFLSKKLSNRTWASIPASCWRNGNVCISCVGGLAFRVCGGTDESHGRPSRGGCVMCYAFVFGFGRVFSLIRGTGLADLSRRVCASVRACVRGLGSWGLLGVRTRLTDPPPSPDAAYVLYFGAFEG